MIFRKNEQDYSGNVYQHSVLERIEEAVNDKLSFEEDYGDQRLILKEEAERLIVGLYNLIEEINN
ncbi:hypothetical protein Grass_202 [Bacillus phage Grass]|uniref:Uncharacterized protein n=1 Tax=Bacillus phage Grass TaxID=1406785 RepID=U5PY03_BPGRA|nr:hypothetical protein Grass_202 [Bacillus phage Grass]AGY47467.1 hypothetical protein Grass_202 [Bacillus phage Grass]UPI13452.1 hypothetical protein [Bacillus phage SBSphiJ7]